MDDRFIIENLLNQDESERLEFKAIANSDSIAKSVTAMLNTSGGDILLGISDDKKLLGLSSGLDVKNMQQMLMNSIRPSAPVDVRCVDMGGKCVGWISVWEGSQKPYHCDGTIYLRTDSQDRKATPIDLKKILSDRKTSDFNWERMPVLGAELEDLDLDEVRKSMIEFNRIGNTIIQDEEEFLMRNGLLVNGNLTNACIVLYAKNPIQFITQAGVRLSVYSSDSSVDLVDTHIFNGNIFKNVEAIFQFIDMTYFKSLKIDGVYRTEQWNYPRIAVREGIMNAIVHRDYNSISGVMNIQIYQNRLEIVSYGALLSTLSFEEMGKTGYSILRNPDIARQCYYRKLIEMMGTGIPRMIQDSRDNGFEIPLFEVKNDLVKVTFPKLVHSRENISKVANASEDIKKYFEGIIEGIIEGITASVKDKLVSILCAIHEQPGLRTVVISDLTNIPLKSLERYMKQLKAAGLIKYIGANRTGGYFLTEQV